MRHFAEDIIRILNTHLNCERVGFVGLGVYDFQIQLLGIGTLQSYGAVTFSIKGRSYHWDEGPNEIPVWSLLDEMPAHFSLVSPETLRLSFASGDYIDFHTAEDEYEHLIINFGKRGDVDVLEIF